MRRIREESNIHNSVPINAFVMSVIVSSVYGNASGSLCNALLALQDNAHELLVTRP
jgi:hypothetical protein